MKKVIAFLLVILSVISLAACGDSSTGIKDKAVKKYQCSFTTYVDNFHDSDTASYQNSSALVQTYATIIRSNRVLEAAAESAGLNYSVAELKEMVQASVGKTAVITVTVNADDPQDAYDLAVAIADTAPAIMKDIVAGSIMKIIDEPAFPSSPIEISLVDNGDFSMGIEDKAEKKYQCSFTAYVSNSHDSEKVSYQDLYAGEKLVQTYVTVIRSNTVLDAAARSAGMNYLDSGLKKMVQASVVGETEVIKVTVTADDPQDAYALANAIAKTAPAKMKDIVEGSSMKIIDYPVYSSTPID